MSNNICVGVHNLLLAAVKRINGKHLYLLSDKDNIDIAWQETVRQLQGIPAIFNKPLKQVFLKNGSEIRFMSVSEPDKLRGLRFDTAAINERVDRAVVQTASACRS